MCYGGSQGGGGLRRSLLGFLALVGMQVKNVIVPMDGIGAQLVAVATSATLPPIARTRARQNGISAMSGVM